MKINAINTNLQRNLQTNMQADIQKKHPQFRTNPMMLPGYANVYKDTISFSGKTLEQIKAERAELETKREELKKQLEYAENFNYLKEKGLSEQAAENEIEDLGLGFFSPFKKMNIRRRHREDLEARWNAVMEIYSKKDLIEAFIAGSEVDLEELDYIEKTRRAKQAKHDILMKKGGMNDVIAGYENEKAELTKRFIDPIIDEKEGLQAHVPPAIVLYGATGTGKTTFVDALAHQSGAKVVNLHTDLEMFKEDLRRKLEDAKKDYLTKGQRTILLFNEAEDLLSDVENSDENRNNVRLFKTLLDKCSNLPENKTDTAQFATTVFITTNYPHLIHKDLRTREGKMGEFIAINPPEQKDMEAVLKFYVKKAEEELKLRPDAEKYNINSETIPYDLLAKRRVPSEEKGAYSNARLQTIVTKAKEAYLENPEKPFQTHLSEVFSKTRRDLGPEAFKEFVKIYKEIAPLELSEYELLQEAELDGCLDAAGKDRLEYYRQIEQAKKGEE